MSRLRDIFNWVISLGKPSWADSMIEEANEATRQMSLSIPKDKLNEAIKCIANGLNDTAFDPERGFMSLSGCAFCRYQLFCSSIDRSMRKAFDKFAKKAQTSHK